MLKIIFDHLVWKLSLHLQKCPSWTFINSDPVYRRIFGTTRITVIWTKTGYLKREHFWICFPMLLICWNSSPNSIGSWSWKYTISSLICNFFSIGAQNFCTSIQKMFSISFQYFTADLYVLLNLKKETASSTCEKAYSPIQQFPCPSTLIKIKLFHRVLRHSYTVTSHFYHSDDNDNF